MTQRHRIGLLCASFRGQNGKGLTEWCLAQLHALQDVSIIESSIEFFIIDIKKAPFPLGPLIDDILPAGIHRSSDYPSAKVRLWSRLVISLSGLVIITPEYNGCYTGELKNALDHIYNEWAGLPVAIISYAVYGGKRAGSLLADALEGLHANIVSQGEIEISLPMEYIAGDRRVGRADQGEDTFLHVYESKMIEVGEKLAAEAVICGR
jgi:NAD(P)H-dependent FMN reductase